MTRFPGSDSEFEALVHKHKSAVYGTAYTYLKYCADIDDIVQETFIQAWLNYGTIRDKDKIGAWLCGVARNLSLKKLRTAKFTLPLDAVTDLVGGDIETAFIRRESRDELHHAIASLPAPTAEAVTLHYLSGKTVREIACLLSISEGTIKSRLHDGRKRLKGALIKQMTNSSDKMPSVDVRRLIELAKDALAKNSCPTAVIRCDEAIAASTDPRILAELYRIRAGAHFTDRDQARADGIAAIGYAKKTGDRRLSAECLLSYAFDCEADTQADAFNEALREAEAANCREVCAESAYWLAANAIQRKDYDAARAYLSDALAHHAKIGSGASAGCCVGDAVRIGALAGAAMESMEMLKSCGRLDGNYISLNTFCQLIRNNGDCLVTDNNYGWNIPGDQPYTKNSFRSHGLLEGQYLLQSTQFDRRDSLDFEYYNWNGALSVRHYALLSRDACITVPAGTFGSCMHIRAYEDDSTDISEFWYAPDIGQVKALFLTDSPYTCELCAYRITPSADPAEKYYPLTIGNRWEYTILNTDGTPFCEKMQNCFTVDRVENGIAYLAESGYAYL